MGDAADQTGVPRVGIREVVSLEGMAERLIMCGAGVDEELLRRECELVTFLRAWEDLDQHTRSPDKTTLLPSRIGLN